MTSDRMNPRGFVSFRGVIKNIFRQLQERYESRSSLPALPTGFAELDAETLGLWPGDLTLIAALPGAGSTSLALNILAHAAFDQNKTVALFSLDLRADEIALRLIAAHGEIKLDVLRTGRMEDEDWSRWSTTITALADDPLKIDDSRTLTAADVRSRVLDLALTRKPDLVVVDRLQNLRWPETITDVESQDGANARALKALARELDVPVVVLSRIDHAPDWFPAHLEGTNQEHVCSPVAHAADTLLYLDRETNRNRQEAESTTAWLILARHRRGQRAKIRLEFDRRYGRFTDPIL